MAVFYAIDPLCDADFERLSHICEASATVAHPATRPERQKHPAGSKRPLADRPWDRAIQQLHRSILGEYWTLGLFLEAFMFDRRYLCDDAYGQYRLNSYLCPVLQSVAAILYEQECGGHLEPIEGAKFNSFIYRIHSVRAVDLIPSLFEHMLVIDYGLGIHPLRGGGFWSPVWFMWRDLIPHVKELAKHLCWMVGQCSQGAIPGMDMLDFMGHRLNQIGYSFNMADVGIMLFYYHTHHTELSQQEYFEGFTGYTGVLNELVAEIPTRGPGRLTRKLSVDFYELIPKCVRNVDLRHELRVAVLQLAIEHGIRIRGPEITKDLSNWAA
ncbi:uncharacterized protein E0L32_002247 [Thyridium curvatum]|uniref:Uncharacterized protein n=1 Tax=Thyridium curvatum TaxID=1093900 RepID=A0A507APJ1_9PEZI|nr:uncharacterized protein E0L32_002247 [Thyridium curvatum]TPX06751.1 hypothetical protein E0L32_002247 [Thyridium curvatum]